MAGPAIEFLNLTRDFGRRRAVDGLNFNIERGEIFGFLGRNGAGKTTTIRCLLGLAKPTSGDALLFGNSIITNRVAALSGVGALVETAALYDSMRARDHLRACAMMANCNDNDSQLDTLLGEVGLAGRERDRVATFSRGMKQRLALATAMLGNPKLLILDEPTDGLDPVGTVEIRKLLKNLRDRGATIFLSSHLLPEVEAACDRVAIIDKGKLLAITHIHDLAGRQTLEEFFLNTVAAGGSA